MNGLSRPYCVLPRYALFPREIFRRDEEDRRRRCRGHRRGGLTKYPAEKIRGTAGVVRELCGLDTGFERFCFWRRSRPRSEAICTTDWSIRPGRERRRRSRFFFQRALQETELLPGLTNGVSGLEGFLFPDTYLVTRSTPARAVVDQMVAQFQKNFTPEMREKAQRLGLTFVQTVTLASIVEKESGLSREGPAIASVYLNRLKRGMRLQADPTVIYALRRDKKWTGTLYRSDYA